MPHCIPRQTPARSFRRHPVELDRAAAGQQEHHVAVARRAGGEGLAREVEAVAVGEVEAVDLVVAGAVANT